MAPDYVLAYLGLGWAAGVGTVELLQWAGRRAYRQHREYFLSRMDHPSIGRYENGHLRVGNALYDQEKEQ